MKTIGARIRYVREGANLTQKEFADELTSNGYGVTRGAVGNWERDQGIKLDNLVAISAVFGVRLEWLSNGAGEPPAIARRAPPPSSPRTRKVAEQVPLLGYVGAGSEAHFYATGDDPAELVDAPDGATENTVAVEIRGESLGTLFDRWLVFYDDVKSPVTTDLIGRLCVVGLPDDKVLVKKIRASRTPGYYHLESNTEGTMTDVLVLWAARVKTMTPR